MTDALIYKLCNRTVLYFAIKADELSENFKFDVLYKRTALLKKCSHNLYSKCNSLKKIFELQIMNASVMLFRLKTSESFELLFEKKYVSENYFKDNVTK